MEYKQIIWKEIIETEKKADAPQTDDAEVSRISLCVVIGLLFLALIWKFAGAQLAKKGIVLSNDTAAKTVSETAPEAEDGSGNAGIKKLAETTPPNETRDGSTARRWWYATDATTYYVNGWADIDGNQYHFDSNGYMATGGKRSAEKAVTLMTRVFTSQTATAR